VAIFAGPKFPLLNTGGFEDPFDESLGALFGETFAVSIARATHTQTIASEA